MVTSTSGRVHAGIFWEIEAQLQVQQKLFELIFMTERTIFCSYIT